MSDYGSYLIKADRWAQFKRNAQKLGFTLSNAVHCYERPASDETTIRIFCNGDQSREIWFMIRRKGGTCYPQTVYRHIFDLIDAGYVDERSEGK